MRLHVVLARPFTGYVVAPSDAKRVVAPPYDALTPKQREALAATDTENYLNVLPSGRSDDAHLEEELARCRESLHALLRTGRFRRVDQPTVALYALTEAGHRQLGVVVDLPLAAFADREVLPHERVQPDRVQRLARYLDIVGVNSSPVCLAHEPDPALATLTAELSDAPPDVAFEDDDGVTQELWLVTDTDAQRRLLVAVGDHERLYLVDGHHRAAAAAAHAAGVGAGSDDAAASVLCVLFPADQLRVLPFHRLVRCDLDDRALAATLADSGVELTPLDGPEAVTGPYHYLMTSGGRWWVAEVAAEAAGADNLDDPVATLDMHVANARLIAPLLDGGDPQRDHRVLPVAAPLGLEALVRPGHVGIVLPSPRVEQVMAVAQAGATMPPKTTYFTPKARSGLLVRPRSRSFYAGAP